MAGRALPMHAAVQVRQRLLLGMLLALDVEPDQVVKVARCDKAWIGG
eukprot:CAMPEP_0203925594 /NCGR_PEP_ID=MMETSP0359-20131031/65220_1 /ASSEMBLY_ACC=CAM_ASM_000338 /TAXON_ID=268821 /ORGANISM="Scrippsiella Hangoei, Strain SHTV-5" /LENGTH=46 /DNA_ID= /DNA_START= /DNA_END= /DNA_ORIENTATION=